MSTSRWRVGRRNPHNVYVQWGDEPRGMNEPDGDTSVGYFRLTGDAEIAVAAVNAMTDAEQVARQDERHEAIWQAAHREFDPDDVLTDIEFAESYGDSVQFAQDMVDRFAPAGPDAEQAGGEQT